MIPEFTIGSLYKSSTHGMVKYEGLDVFHGETTLKFTAIEFSQTCYWMESSLENHFKEEKMDIPEDFKIEHDRLIDEIEPLATRLREIASELPTKATTEIIHYNGFKLTIERE